VLNNPAGWLDREVEAAFDPVFQAWLDPDRTAP